MTQAGAIPQLKAPFTPDESDERLAKHWLEGRPDNTQAAYRLDADRFLAFARKPLLSVTLGDIQTYADSLNHLAPSTRARCLSVVKSLFSFGQRLGYLPYNVAAAVRVPPATNTRAKRILPEAEVHRLLAIEPDNRNRTLLRLLYVGGLRVSELAALTWRHLSDRSDGSGQLTVSGNDQRSRVVLIPASIYSELRALGNGTQTDAPIFRSRKGGHLTRGQVLRIVRAAAQRAGVELPVSPHLLRYAHASHALDHGAPIHLIHATLGHSSVAAIGKYPDPLPTDSSSSYLTV